MPTYFGVTTVGGETDSGNTNYLMWHNPAVVAYNCPGSGNQTIQELSAHVRYNSAATYHVRICVYSAAGALLCQSESAVVDNATYAWKGTTNPANTDPANYNLVGGTQYILCLHIENADTRIAYAVLTAAMKKTTNYPYSGGPAATLPAGNNYIANFSIRCGVDAAAGGLSIPVARPYTQAVNRAAVY